MKLPKIRTKRIKEFFKKLLKSLGEKAFLTFLVLLLVALIFGGIIFYQYGILAKKTEIQITEKPLQFKESVYQDILRAWQEREERFNKAETKQYLNPFEAPTITE